MGFFDNDPFEEIVREFFGDSSIRKRRTSPIIHGEEEDRVVDVIENDDKIYLIFELPGYNLKDITVSIDNNVLEIYAKKKNCDLSSVQNYLSQKLCDGVFIKKTLPKFVNSKSFNHTLNNGILEISFNKK